MSFKGIHLLLTTVALALIFINEAAHAKAKAANLLTKNENTTAPTGVSAITAFQERLLPILTNRIIRRRPNMHPPVKAVSLHEPDLVTLAKVWNSLSPQFKELYLKSVEIPDGLNYHSSPGGHFEIYFETDGNNKVDTTDILGFSTANWREKTAIPNGVPDYVDEVGFALDSSWSMEIDRFGLVPPLAYKDGVYQSDRYKVLIEEQADSFYGITYLFTKDTTAQKGFSSYISLRNTWDNPEWYDLGYDKHPENGIRVTCAHEFFHAIQYAMCWNVESVVNLDDFPYGWTEGAATSMEELAFESIDDYHQYSEAYFFNPEISFFNRFDDDHLYTNAILFLYLYRHLQSGGSIDFVRSMLYASYETKQLSFSENLLSAGSRHGSSWPILLHDFHQASFKTGTFADSTTFISDAHFFSMTKGAPLTGTDTVHRTMATNSTYHVHLVKQNDHADTVCLNVASSFTNSSPATANQRPSYSVRLSTATTDSFIQVTTDSNGDGILLVNSWKKWNDLTVIATNANPVRASMVTLFLQPYPVSYRASEIIIDTIVEYRYNSTATLHIEARNDLHQDYTFEEIPTNPSTEPDDDTYFAITGFFSVAFPRFWIGNASITLSLKSALPVDSGDTVYLGRWDHENNEWTPCSSGKTGASDTLTVSDSITVSGIYTLLKKRGETTEIKPVLTVYPNPFSFENHNGRLFIRGNDITHISIYSLNGAIIWKYFSNSSSTSSLHKIVTHQWEPISAAHKKLAPGIYQLIVEQNNAVTDVSHTTRHKLIIAP